MAGNNASEWLDYVSKKHGMSAAEAEAPEKEKTLQERMEGVTFKPQFGNASISGKEKDGVLSITVAYKASKDLAKGNYKVWVVPFYYAATVQVSVEGTGKLSDTAKSLSVALKAEGSFETGPGAKTDLFTVGAYGKAKLSAVNNALTVTRCDAPAGGEASWGIEATNISLWATGSVGVKATLKNGPGADLYVDVTNWELVVLSLGKYEKGKFSSVELRPGKDLQRFITAMQNLGRTLSDAVEKYAPESVKQAAVDGATWVAESPEAKQIADDVEKEVKKVEEATGLKVGDGVESVVRDLVDPGGETSAEATERVQREMQEFGNSAEEMRKAMVAAGLESGPLFRYRTAEEYNEVVDCWGQEAEAAIKGGAKTEKWKSLLVALVEKANARRKAAEEAKRKAESEAKKEVDEALEQQIKAALSTMEAARPKGQGPVNVLNNKLIANPNPDARKKNFEPAWRVWDNAEKARKAALSAQGADKIPLAQQAMQLYLQAGDMGTEGIRHL